VRFNGGVLFFHALVPGDLATFTEAVAVELTRESFRS
jgi:hypothetical protein